VTEKHVSSKKYKLFRPKAHQPLQQHRAFIELGQSVETHPRPSTVLDFEWYGNSNEVSAILLIESD
jgi:hypothetical protein